MGDTILGGFGMDFEVMESEYKRSEKFNEEFKLVEDGYNYLNSDSKKKIINWCLDVIEKENAFFESAHFFKKYAEHLIPNIDFWYFIELYSLKEDEQINFLQTLQYLISRRIVNENLEPIKEKNTNKNLELDINIVNRGYKILNDEGKIKIINWCIDKLEKNKKIKLNNKQFSDIFIGDINFEALANIYSKQEENQIEFLQNIASIMQELISLNLVDENYGQKKYVKK